MTITVPVEDVTKGMYLHEIIGKGKFGDTEFELCVAHPHHSPFIIIGEARYLVPINQIVQKVINLHEKEMLRHKRGIPPSVEPETELPDGHPD